MTAVTVSIPDFWLGTLVGALTFLVVFLIWGLWSVRNKG